MDSVLQELARWDSEGVGQGVDVVEADVALSPLDAAYVSTVQVGGFG